MKENVVMKGTDMDLIVVRQQSHLGCKVGSKCTYACVEIR